MDIINVYSHCILNYESVNDTRPYIDEMVSIYLATNHATEM
ncbi:hypothetical protein [Virgibacillus pantothenticus]|nr:hypothetical protein [Virgibacillus pantothenticus]